MYEKKKEKKSASHLQSSYSWLGLERKHLGLPYLSWVLGKTDLSKLKNQIRWGRIQHLIRVHDLLLIEQYLATSRGSKKDVFKFNFYHSTGKISTGQIGDIFIIFLENRLWHFMQIVSFRAAENKRPMGQVLLIREKQLVQICRCYATVFQFCHCN